MKKICFYFQVHQPFRTSKFTAFDINHENNYFHGPLNGENQKIFEKVANKCYLPANQAFLALLHKHPEFKISFSISGVFLDQCQSFSQIGQKVLQSFQKLVKTGQVEILGETYYHSLSALKSTEEFKIQVKKHRQTIKKLFKVTPKVFRNTELIFNDQIGRLAYDMGFNGVLAEGWETVLKGRSPNMVYKLPKQICRSKKFGILLKNYRLSDDIAFRFSNQNWEHYPLTTNKFTDWTLQNHGDQINLFMDYETFGEHQWSESGIFEFLKHLPETLLKNKIKFVTPTEAIAENPQKEEIQIPHYISWADSERDLSAWLGNNMQKACFDRLYQIEQNIKETADQDLIEKWRKLQTSDHFYYMCTKYWNDGDVHKYFSPFNSPYEAFINYSNILTDLEHHVEKNLAQKKHHRNRHWRHKNSPRKVSNHKQPLKTT